MSFIKERNPVYRELFTPSVVRGELLNKQLIGIDLVVAGEIISIKTKQKYMVKHSQYLWHEEEYTYVSSPYADLYSVMDVTIHENQVYITFAYHNTSTFTISEENIMALVHVRKKARREDLDVQKMIQHLMQGDMVEIKKDYE